MFSPRSLKYVEPGESMWYRTYSMLIYTDGTGYKGGGVSTFGLELGGKI